MSRTWLMAWVALYIVERLMSRSRSQPAATSGAWRTREPSPTEVSGPTPLIGAVGMLQFDVMLHRLEHEYGVRCRLEKMAGRYPRWVTGPKDAIERVGRERGRSSCSGTSASRPRNSAWTPTRMS